MSSCQFVMTLSARVTSDALLEKLGDGTAFGAAAGLTHYYLTLSNIENAAAWFEKAVVQRDTRAPWILSHQFGGRASVKPPLAAARGNDEPARHRRKRIFVAVALVGNNIQL